MNVDNREKVPPNRCENICSIDHFLRFWNFYINGAIFRIHDEGEILSTPVPTLIFEW